MRIARDTQVTYDRHVIDPIDTIGIEGHLVFEPQANTLLHVTHLLVYRMGFLEIGRIEKPIARQASATIVFNDHPFDYEEDPKQYGNGLLVFGKLRVHGAGMPSTFIRLEEEVMTGSRVLHLEVPADQWRVGDRLYIPEYSSN